VLAKPDRYSRSVGEEEDGGGLGRWVFEEDAEVSAGMAAMDDFGGGRGLDAQAFGADGHPPVGSDFDVGSLRPDVWPPGALGGGSQNASFFGQRFFPGFLRGHVQLAVGFGGVAVGAELVDFGVGFFQAGDLFAGEVGGQAVLPILVGALHFAFGLRGGRVAEVDAVKAQGPAELGGGLGPRGKEEAVVIDVQLQGQAKVQEGPGQQIQIGQERFALVNFGGDKKAAAIVEHVEHRPVAFGGGEPGVGCGVQLPEFADGAALPAAHGRFGLGSGLNLGQAVLHGPAPNLRAMDFQIQQPGRFAGGEAVGSGRAAGEPFAQESRQFRRPIRGMVAAG
jgi:hypothetical protein